MCLLVKRGIQQRNYETDTHINQTPNTDCSVLTSTGWNSKNWEELIECEWLATSWSLLTLGQGEECDNIINTQASLYTILLTLRPHYSYSADLVLIEGCPRLPSLQPRGQPQNGALWWPRGRGLRLLQLGVKPQGAALGDVTCRPETWVPAINIFSTL